MEKLALKRCRKNGITLIELLVALTILGIISVTAVGYYGDYIIKTYRSTAQTTMIEILAGQQDYFARNMTYVTDLSELGYNLVDGKLGISDGRYEITADNCAAPLSTSLTVCVALTASATTTGNQSSDGDLAANSAGGKTPIEKW